MNILKEGDKKKVACGCCGSFQEATFKLRNVPFSDGSGIVKNVLVGVCDNCDSVAVIPHQSTPAIQKQLKDQRQSVESRLPSHMLDILNLASGRVGATPDFSSTLVKFYIHALSSDEISPANLKRLLGSDLAQGKASKRLSLKGRHVAEELEALRVATEIGTTTELLKSVVLKINDDILVHKRPTRIKVLESLAAATA